MMRAITALFIWFTKWPEKNYFYTPTHQDLDNDITYHGLLRTSYRSILLGALHGVAAESKKISHGPHGALWDVSYRIISK